MSYLRHPAAVGLLHAQGDARRLGFRQPGRGGRAVFAHEEDFLLLPFLRNDLEESASAMQCPDRIPVVKEPAFRPLSIVETGLESHPARQTLHEVAALGIEGKLQLAVLSRIGIEAAHGPEGHVVRVFARLDGFVVDGEHAAVELLIVAEVLPLLPFAREPLFYLFGMPALEASPVELPTGVGPELVEAGVLDLSVQGEESLAAPLFHPDEFALYHVPLLPEELHIEHAAHVGRTARIGAAQVGREPDCIAKLVAGVVHVDEDLLLRNGPAKGRLPLGKLVEPRLLSMGKDGRQAKEEKNLRVHSCHTVLYIQCQKLRFVTERRHKVTKKP